METAADSPQGVSIFNGVIWLAMICSPGQWLQSFQNGWNFTATTFGEKQVETATGQLFVDQVRVKFFQGIVGGAQLQGKIGQ